MLLYTAALKPSTTIGTLSTLRQIATIVNLHETRVSQLKSQAILRMRSSVRMKWPT